MANSNLKHMIITKEEIARNRERFPRVKVDRTLGSLVNQGILGGSEVMSIREARRMFDDDFNQEGNQRFFRSYDATVWRTKVGDKDIRLQGFTRIIVGEKPVEAENPSIQERAEYLIDCLLMWLGMINIWDRCMVEYRGAKGKKGWIHRPCMPIGDKMELLFNWEVDKLVNKYRFPEPLPNGIPNHPFIRILRSRVYRALVMDSRIPKMVEDKGISKMLMGKHLYRWRRIQHRNGREDYGLQILGKSPEYFEDVVKYRKHLAEDTELVDYKDEIMSRRKNILSHYATSYEQNTGFPPEDWQPQRFLDERPFASLVLHETADGEQFDVPISSKRMIYMMREDPIEKPTAMKRLVGTMKAVKHHCVWCKFLDIFALMEETDGIMVMRIPEVLLGEAKFEMEWGRWKPDRYEAVIDQLKRRCEAANYFKQLEKMALNLLNE